MEKVLSDREFLDELRNQFDRLVNAKTRLDGKASGMITMSGTIASLLMVFGVFLLRSINPDFELFVYIFYVLVGGILALMGCIVWNIFSYKIRTQTYPIGSDRFFKNKKYDYPEVKLWRESSSDDFNRRMFRDYIDSMKDFEDRIETKGYRIYISQWFFLAGVCSIPIITGITIKAILDKMILIQPLI